MTNPHSPVYSSPKVCVSFCSLNWTKIASAQIQLIKLKVSNGYPQKNALHTSLQKINQQHPHRDIERDFISFPNSIYFSILLRYTRVNVNGISMTNPHTLVYSSPKVCASFCSLNWTKIASAQIQLIKPKVSNGYPQKNALHTSLQEINQQHSHQDIEQDFISFPNSIYFSILLQYTRVNVNGISMTNPHTLVYSSPKVCASFCSLNWTKIASAQLQLIKLKVSTDIHRKMHYTLRFKR